MTKPIEVGCIVEVIRTERLKYAMWVGRQLVVTGFADFIGRNGPGVLTSPNPFRCKPLRGWNPANLRRVDPPDWQAPITETETLDTPA